MNKQIKTYYHSNTALNFIMEALITQGGFSEKTADFKGVE